MFHGNLHSRELLVKYMDFALSDGDQKISFFLVSGPTGIGKTSVILEIVQKILGNYFLQDFLHIKDFSQNIGKKHNLKVSSKEESEVSKLLSEEFNYQDIGTREINQWLSQSITGTAKIVLIENIERMTPGAINAFLKSCEEPLKRRIIIATTNNVSQIIDTIISRAIIIPFSTLSRDELFSFCEEKKIFADHPTLKEFLCFMSMGKPGLMVRFYELFSSDESLMHEIEEMVPLFTTSSNLHKKQLFLSKIAKLGLLDQFLDGLIYFFVDKRDFIRATTRLNIKKGLNVNINVEHLIFSGLLV